MIRALIVDDERLARAELRRLLQTFPQVEVVGEAAHALAALTEIRKLAPDLLFLDIEMPGGSGFDLLEQLDAVPRVIFTTAYDQHALRAFEVNALDYLLKPIDPQRLARALDRLPVTPTEEAAPPDRLFVRDGERCWFLSLDEIPFFESEGNYARVCVSGPQPLLPRSLNHLEAQLDPRRFFRASRQHLVNLDWVSGVEPGPSGRLVLTLETGREIEMSRRQSQKFRERMSP